MQVNQQVPTTPFVRVASAEPQEAAPQEVAPEDSFEEVSVGGVLTSVARTVVGTVFGAGAAVGTSLVTACAGGAEGAVYATGVKGEDKELYRSGVMAANMAAMGAITGHYAASQATVGVLAAAGIGLGQGMITWRNLPEETKERVFETADRWTDAVLPEELPEGVAGQAIGAVVGEGTGLVAGLLVGLSEGFKSGQEMGHELVDGLAARMASEEATA